MKKFAVVLLCFVIISATLVFGSYFYMKQSYGIDVFVAIGQFEKLSEKVDEKSVFPMKFSEEDASAAFESVNGCGTDVITCNEKGECVFNYRSGKMTRAVILTEKQTAGLLSVLMKNSSGSLTVGDKELSAEVIQVIIDNVDEKGGAEVKLTLKIKTDNLKKFMNAFPSSVMRGLFPDELYVTSVFRMEKSDSEFSFEVKPQSLLLNGFSSAETQDILNSLGSFVKIDADVFNSALAETFTGLLIGTDENLGFATSLKALGAKDVKFADLSAGAGFEKVFAVVI